MTATTFDTLACAQQLEQAGISRGQAEAITRGIADAQNETITKADLEMALAPIRTDLAVLKWMIGLSLAGSVSIVSLLIKLFF